jgi:hypothetical protein
MKVYKFKAISTATPMIKTILVKRDRQIIFIQHLLAVSHLILIGTFILWLVQRFWL